MFSKRSFSVLISTLMLATCISTGCGLGGPKLSEGDQQKIAALNDALKNGLLTQQEHDAKVKEIYAAAASGKPSPANTSSTSDAQKLQALEKACSTGALTPDECTQKRAELNGGSSSASSMQPDATGSSAMPPPMPTSSSASPNGSNSANPSQAPLSGDAFANPSQSNSAANSYNDPQGQFSVAIPPGWTPAPQGNNGAGGVQIMQGASYAVVAPFGGVSQPSDVVINLEGQFQKTYQNFTIGQHGPSKLNGLDIAFGKYRGINAKGVPVSMVIMGIAAPGGHFYLFLTSAPQTDEQASDPGFNSILQSLHFAGQ
jgi:hypothetical protein